MNEQSNTNEGTCRTCWQNCGVQADAEMLDIDKMEDAIAPLDEQAVRIRELITRFEACYHEADKQAKLIARAIGAGRCPEESNERPPERKKELENSRLILSRWCEDPIHGQNHEVTITGPSRFLASIQLKTENHYIIYCVSSIPDIS
jgi:hypothetical protein